MLLLKHTAGSSSSGNITAPNPNSCPSQDPDCPFPASRAGFAAAPSPTGGSSTASTQICCKRGHGGCKIGPSEVPPAQSFSPGLKQGAGLGGIFNNLTQRNSFKSSKFKARAIPSGSRGPLASKGNQNLEEKRWGSAAPPSCCKVLPVSVRILGRALYPAGERDKAAPKSTTSIRRARGPRMHRRGFGVPRPP